MEAAVASSGAAARAETDHLFFRSMAVISAAVILAGFASRDLPRVWSGEPVPPIIHLHAAVFTGWLGLFIAQTTLVGRGRIEMHRRLGMASALFALFMLAIGVQATLVVTRMGHRGIPGVMFADPAGFMLLNFVAIGVFIVLVAAGWAFRRKPQTHKRLMLMAALSLLGPRVSRLPLVAGHVPAVAAVRLTLLIAGPIYDFVTRRKVHPAYIFGVLLIVVPGPPLLAKIAATPGWQRVAASLL
jgi:uncharacterized membrane protein YozB (DUF420 family)